MSASGPLVEKDRRRIVAHRNSFFFLFSLISPKLKELSSLFNLLGLSASLPSLFISVLPSR